ncbi:hypothetical protein ACWGF3_13595 [Streptomyces xanthophaeus]
MDLGAQRAGALEVGEGAGFAGEAATLRVRAVARWSSQELLGEGDFVVGPAGVGEGVREGEVGLGDGLLPSVDVLFSLGAGGEAVAARYLFGDDKYKPNQNPLTCSAPLKKLTTGSSDGWAGGTFAEVNCKATSPEPQAAPS